MNRLVFREALRAQHAGVDGMIRIAPDAHGAAVPDADEHPASDGAVPARRRYPSVRHAARRRVPVDFVVAVGVTIGQGVETEHTSERHAASLPRYGAVGCFGTALTKNRYRPMTSPASARPNAAHRMSAFDVKSGSAMAPSASSTPRPIKGPRNVVASRREEAWSSTVS